VWRSTIGPDVKAPAACGSIRSGRNDLGGEQTWRNIKEYLQPRDRGLREVVFRGTEAGSRPNLPAVRRSRSPSAGAHLRRKSVDIAKDGSAPIASKALERIAALYLIENAIRGQSAGERRTVRQDRSKPLVLALKAWFEQQLARVSAKVRDRRSHPLRLVFSRLDVLSDLDSGRIRVGAACDLNWDGLSRFLDDGRNELDTNIVERVRPIAPNPKNALFAGHDQGAENWACIASLIETALCRSRHKAVYAAHGTMPNELVFPRIGADRDVIGSA
jgi:hypothetical protein